MFKSVEPEDSDADMASAPATPGRNADAEWAAGVSDDEGDDEATLEEEEVCMWTIAETYTVVAGLQTLLCERRVGGWRVGRWG